MERYAAIVDGKIVDIRRRSGKPKDVPHKKLVWLPYTEETVDNSTGNKTVSTRGEEVIEAKRVVRTTTIRDKTKKEKEDDAVLEKNAQIQQLSTENNLLKALAKGLHELINEVRASKVPKGKAMTDAEFDAYLRDLMS